MKKLIFFLLIVFIPFNSYAHLDHYKNIKKIEMEIFKDGKKIGFNDYFFFKDKQKFTVKNNTKFKVNILGLNVLTMESESEEVYFDNNLLSFRSETLQNNKKKYVYVNLSPDKNFYKIEGSSYKGKINLDTIIGSWWNHKVLSFNQHISPISGSIKRYSINFKDKQMLSLNGNKYEASHFKIISKEEASNKEKTNLDIWIDNKTNLIIKVIYSKYGKWEYRLKIIEYLN